MKNFSKSSFISLIFFDSTMIFHLWIILILLHIFSASASMCVLKNIVVHSSFSSRSKSLTIFLQIGSSQLIGSSKNRSLGSFMID